MQLGSLLSPLHGLSFHNVIQFLKLNIWYNSRCRVVIYAVLPELAQSTGCLDWRCLSRGIFTPIMVLILRSAFFVLLHFAVFCCVLRRR